MSASALLLLYSVSGMARLVSIDVVLASDEHIQHSSRDASHAYSNNKHFFPPRVRSGDTPMILHFLESAAPTTHKPPRPPWLPGVPERDLATGTNDTNFSNLSRIATRPLLDPEGPPVN
ncbi:hypothetical protein EDB84DRAFT_1442921 [Lactarius hengduanensis]|nr:hypothetical protein EDB84DRAFT_1442921 [Lactarius hengduanensis]